MRPNIEPSTSDSSDGQISQAVWDCLESFRQFMSMREEPATQTILPTIRDEETRFKVWSGNIGAHKHGRSSLDYRLRDASHLQTQVLGLLAELTTLLVDVIAIVRGDKVPWEMLDEDPLRGEEEDDGIPETELGQIATDVVEVVNCLLRLSISIRNPAPHDRLSSSTGNKTRHYEAFDIQHVRSKFGTVNDTIARRLGKAISKRREYFRYRESHHAKLSHGLEPDVDHEEHGSTIASSIPQQMKDAGVAASTSRMPVVNEDTSSVMDMSETSFASSTGDSDKLKVPPLPKEAHRGPFECPFCFMMIVATNTKSWKRHVYADLRPYVCLSEDCQTPESEFDRRRDWMQHELQNHWRTYACPFGCPDDLRYPSATSLRGHINSYHKSNASSSQLEALIDLSARPLNIGDGIDCRLCGETLFSIQTYGRHVGRHQEQISLFALPSLAHADGDESSSGEDSTSSDNEVDKASAAVDSSEVPRYGINQPPGPYNTYVPSLGRPDSPSPGRTLHVQEGDDKKNQPRLGPNRAGVSEIVAKAYGALDKPNPTSRSQSAGIQLQSRNPWYQPQESQPAVPTVPYLSYPAASILLDDRNRESGDARDKLFRDRVVNNDRSPGRPASMVRVRNDKTTSRRPVPAGVTNTSEGDDEDVTVRVMGDAIIQVGGQRMRVRDGAEINISHLSAGLTTIPVSDWGRPGQGSQPSYDRPQAVTGIQQVSARRAIIMPVEEVDQWENVVQGSGRYTGPVTFEQPADRRSRFAQVEDADESGNVTEGKDRFAYPVNDPSAASPFMRGETRTLEARFQRDPSPGRRKSTEGLKASHFGILKKPTPHFPEDKNPIREGVPPRKNDKTKQGNTSPTAKSTKISRRMVNPEALTIGKERFEVRDDLLLVMRVLTKEEIQSYVDLTKALRESKLQSQGKGDKQSGATRPSVPKTIYTNPPPPVYPAFPSIYPFSKAAIEEYRDVLPTLANSPNPAIRRQSIPVLNYMETRSEALAVIPLAPTSTRNKKSPQREPSQPQRPQSPSRRVSTGHPIQEPPTTQGGKQPLRRNFFNVPDLEDESPPAKETRDHKADKEGSASYQSSTAKTKQKQREPELAANSPVAQGERDPDKKLPPKGQGAESSTVAWWATYNKLEREKARLQSLNDPIFASAIKELAAEMYRVRVGIFKAEQL